MKTTDEQLSRIIELLETLVQQNVPPPSLYEMEATKAMREAIARGDRQRVKELNRAMHARKGIKI